MDDYLTVSQFCAKYGKDPGNVRKLIKAGQIPAKKLGSQWVIPSDVLPPADRRIKTGKYINWRKKPASDEPEE